jgi:hypothetical protein
VDIDDTDADRALVATERFQHKLRHPERVLLSKHVKVMVILVWCVCVCERERERESERECVWCPWIKTREVSSHAAPTL